MEKTVEEHKGIELLDSGKREFHEVVERFGKILGEAAELSRHYLYSYDDQQGESKKGLVDEISSCIKNGMGSLDETAGTVVSQLVYETDNETEKIKRIDEAGTGVNHSEQIIEVSKSLFDKLEHSESEEDFVTRTKEIISLVGEEKNFVSSLLIDGGQAAETISVAIQRAIELYGNKGDEFQRSLIRLSELDEGKRDDYKKSLDQRYKTLLDIKSDRLEEILSKLRIEKYGKDSEK